MSGLRRTIGRHLYLLMVLPALVLYLTFIIYPFIRSVHLSLYRWPGVGPMKWVGLENYADFLFKPPFSEMFWRAIGHNIQVLGLNVLYSLAVGLFIAYILSTRPRGHEAYKTIFFLPHTLSLVITGFLWSLLLHPQWGAVNAVLKAIGADFLAKAWLGDSKLALPTIITIIAWHNLGFPILVYLAAILGVPRELHEAASVDGATERVRFFRITLPLILPAMLTLSVFTFIGSFGVFELIFTLQGAEAGPYYSTDVLGTLFYRTAFGGMGSTMQDMGLGASLAVVIFLIVFPVSIAATILQRRVSVEH